MSSMSCTDSKVEQMFKLLLDAEEKDLDKKQKVSLFPVWVREKCLCRARLLQGHPPLPLFKAKSFGSLSSGTEVGLQSP